jgi:hypothetical protein
MRAGALTVATSAAHPSRQTLPLPSPFLSRARNDSVDGVHNNNNNNNKK